MRAMLPALFLILFSSSFSAQAGSLLVRKQWVEQEAEIAGDLETIQAKCGIKPEFVFDKAGFASWDLESKKVARKCSRTLEELGRICEESKEGKDAVRAKVKRIECAPRADDAPERYALKNGAYQFTVSDKNWNQYAADWLKKNLSDTNLVVAQQFADAEKRLSELTRDLNSKCQSELKYEIDRKSFAGRAPNALVPSYCERMIDALKDRCDDEPKRKTLVAKVKTLVCRAEPIADSKFKQLDGAKLIFELGTGGGMDSRELNNGLDNFLR